MRSVEAAWLKPVSDGEGVEGEVGRAGQGRSGRALDFFF